MIEWIVKNKDWLFSGVGVVVIAALVRWLVTLVWPRPAAKPVLPTSPGHRESYDVSADDIIKAIEQVPPFQRPSIARHYVGLKVEWPARFSSATSLGDDMVSVSLKYGWKNTFFLGPWIYCNVGLADHKEIAVLHEGAPVTVRGTIDSVEHGYIRLKDATLVFGS